MHNIVDMAKRQVTTKIIGGKFKGTKLPFKPTKTLRPTESKTKETLFNWLFNDLDKTKCLDMFSGTGSLGFEALSRGATHITFIEKQKGLCESMDTLAKKLNIKSQVKIINANAMALDFESINESYDLIFLDPPFNEGLVKKALDIISKYNLLKECGCLYIECEKDLDVESISTDFSKLKESKSGEAKYYLYAS